VTGGLVKWNSNSSRGWKMFYGTSFVVTCLYGMKVKPDPKRDKKLKSAIEYLGEKYCLAKPVEKING
jgi:hypothetical protein